MLKSHFNTFLDKTKNDVGYTSKGIEGNRKKVLVL